MLGKGKGFRDESVNNLMLEGRVLIGKGESSVKVESNQSFAVSYEEEKRELLLN